MTTGIELQHIETPHHRILAGERVDGWRVINIKTNMKEYMDIAYRASLQAGAEILKVYESDDFNVESKADNSPLTLADRRAHSVIEEALKQTGLPMLSEEGAQIPSGQRSHWDLYWLIDPLDGTKEFIKRNGEFTVNIALMAPHKVPQKAPNMASNEAPNTAPADHHVPIAGVVYVPVKDIAYIGLQDEGAWKITDASQAGPQAGQMAGPSAAAAELSDTLAAGRKLPVLTPHTRPFAAVMSRSHNSLETEQYVAGLEEKFGPAQRVSSGSSIKLCLVAEGTADVYPRFAPTMEWDTAAGDAVCRAAECRVSQQDGQTPLLYNKENLLNPWFIVQGPRLIKQKSE